MTWCCERHVIHRRITYINGEHADWIATTTVYGLTAREAKARGLGGAS
ncbi:MAG TPA: hypothetical protein VJT31_12835 [Rugosimonospora sp.]|nr:hypothetical protein [Rugosimonospora sp.]